MHRNPRPATLFRRLASPPAVRLARHAIALGVRAAPSRTFELLVEPLKRVHRGQALALSRLLEFERVLDRAQLRILPLKAIFEGADDVSVPLGVIHESVGMAKTAEYSFLLGALKLLQPRVVFEIGTHYGMTTLYMARELPEARIITLDLPPGEDFVGGRVGERFAGTPEASRIEQLRIDSRALDTGPFRGAVDAIFVDADHSYDAVRNDTEKAFEMLRPGGTIFWHDFTAKSPGVASYIADLSQERSLFWIWNTSIVLYRDGVDAREFRPVDGALDPARGTQSEHEMTRRRFKPIRKV